MSRPIKCPDYIKLGELRTTSRSGDYRVIAYEGTFKVLIQFEDTEHRRYVHASHVKTNHVKDPTRPSVHGVGFLGEYYNSVTSPRAHAVWSSMLGRCYSPAVQKVRPTYLGCTVCTEWHNFSNFVLWYEAHVTEGMHLDKDILIEGNKVYSPATCIITSPKENISKMSQRPFNIEAPCSDARVEGVNLKRFCEENGYDYKKSHRYNKLKRASS